MRVCDQNFKAVNELASFKKKSAAIECKCNLQTGATLTDMHHPCQAVAPGH